MDNKVKELEKRLADAQSQIAEYKAIRLNASTSGSTTQDFATAEKKAVAKFGVKSISGKTIGKKRVEDGLLHVNVADRRYKFLSSEEKEAVIALKEGNDIALMEAQVFDKEVSQTKGYHELVKPALKAFGIDSGDAGYEWIPTAVSESYVDEYNLERKVAGLFDEIKMPSNPYVFPVLSNGAIARKLAEVSALTAQTFTTSSSITLTAVKLANQYALPEELNEDSAVDVMKVIRMQLIKGQEKAIEIAILEGDADGSNQHYATMLADDSGTIDSDSCENAFNGLRKRCLASTNLKLSASNATLTESHLAQARRGMGKFGVNPAELAIIVGPKAYNQMLQLDDVRTLEQYGPQAPVLSGELAKYEGIPVIVSEYLREDTHTSGVNANGGTNTHLSVILVNRKRWFVGLRRAIQVRVESFRTHYDVWDMVSYQRKAFQGVLAADAANEASEPSAFLIYNIAAS